ncbi:hypothetical protein COCNU_scaffold013165G000010 [Cocos nucifera]|nr:hypothetical protein [Cocos nucifera]
MPSLDPGAPSSDLGPCIGRKNGGPAPSRRQPAAMDRHRPRTTARPPPDLGTPPSDLDAPSPSDLGPASGGRTEAVRHLANSAPCATSPAQIRVPPHQIWAQPPPNRRSIVGSMLPGPTLRCTRASCRVPPATAVGCSLLLARAPTVCATTGIDAAACDVPPRRRRRPCHPLPDLPHLAREHHRRLPACENCLHMPRSATSSSEPPLCANSRLLSPRSTANHRLPPDLEGRKGGLPAPKIFLFRG